MDINNLKDMYFAELQELASVERLLADSLQEAAGKAFHPSLRDAISNHREETVRQKERIEGILQKHGISPSEHTDQGMQALIKETEKMMGMLNGDALRDVGLIASAQKIEHYEIAAYGTVCSLAKLLGLEEDKKTLGESLDEEKQADALLTRLAEQEVNQDAVAA